MAADLTREISTHLTAKGLPPARPWLDAFIPTVRPSHPLPAIKQTALFRILAADITQALSHSASANALPRDIATGTVKERVVAGPVAVQVLDVEDVGRSRWSQVEALEAAARGETTKGREIIRVVDGGDEAGDGAGGGTQAAGAENESGGSSGGPHKLLLVDAAGTKAYGFELFPVEGVSVRMTMGAKLVLRNVVVARGMLLLEPGTTVCLGGKVEALHKAWKDGKLERLKEAAGMQDR